MYFATGFGKIVYILADFGKQEYCRTRKFCIFMDGIRQSSNPTDTDIALSLCQGVNDILVPKYDQ